MVKSVDRTQSTNYAMKTVGTTQIYATNEGISFKTKTKLKGDTYASLSSPQPGDFMYALNKMSGFIDFSA